MKAIKNSVLIITGKSNENVRGFENIFKLIFIDTLQIGKIKRKNFDVAIIKKELLRDADKGRKILKSLFKLKKERGFLIGIEGTGDYKKDKEYLGMKKEGTPLIDIFFPYLDAKKDYMHSSNSGTNHVIMNILKKNLIALGINLSEIIRRIKKEDFVYISRNLQNIVWGRKRKINLCLILEIKKKDIVYNSYDILHFLLSIGMSTEQAKNAIIFAKIKKELNKEIFLHKTGSIYIYKKDEKINLINYLNTIGQ